jgi:hypothetical protein
LGACYITPDEAFSWRVIQYPLFETLCRVGRDGHAPLYFVVLCGWQWLWGDSLVALRSLSVLFGTASVVTVYFLVQEAMGFATTAWAAESQAVDRTTWPRLVCPAAAPAVVAGFAAAIHPLQVIAGRTARMYSLGVMLAALSGWLLLRAMRSDRPSWWWTGYGVVAALFCYTHHFAMFTLLAQAVFVGGSVAYGYRRSASPEDRARASAAGWGCLMAGALAFALYSPWLPVFRHQATEVLAGFWIQPKSAGETVGTVLAWTTGPDWFPSPLVPLLIVLGGAALVWVAARGGDAGRFFVLQAVVPWVCCLGISTLGRRPLLEVRYLAFAQVALFGFWGTLVAAIPRPTARAGVAALIALFASVGFFGVGHLDARTEHPAMAALRFLGEHHRKGDLILVSDPASVNQTRYTARQIGLDEIDVRCLSSGVSSTGHTNHIASIRRSEIAEGERRPWAQVAPRIWRVFEHKSRGSDCRTAVSTPLHDEACTPVSHWSSCSWSSQ